MLKFHTYEWNKRDREYTMVFLDEIDMILKSPIRGAGIDILVIPQKFADIHNEYLDNFISIIKAREGSKIIYV
jgi:hypothetical protein